MLITPLEQTVIPHNSLYLTKHEFYKKIVDYPTCAKNAFLMLTISLERIAITIKTCTLPSIHHNRNFLIPSHRQKHAFLMLITSLEPIGIPHNSMYFINEIC